MAIWSVAESAITEQPRRELVLIAGARKLESLYMLPALCRLALFPNVTIIPVVSEQQTMSNAVRKGSPLDYVPPLSRDDVVYCAGAPAMVEAISHVASESGAKCYSDPFKPAVSKDDKAGLLSRAADWLGSSELKSGEMLTSPPLSMADWTPLDANGESQSGRERRERHSVSADLYPNQAAPA